jgi:protein-tyrosine phosphatase
MIRGLLAVKSTFVSDLRDCLMTKLPVRLFAVLATFSISSAAFAIDKAEVHRDAATLVVQWQSANPVDVYLVSSSDADIASGTKVSSHDVDGEYSVQDTSTDRQYFVLRDTKNGTELRVAEREIVLEKGSNFRDLGGYVGAGGRTVRWGHIYRSGAMPMLTETDFSRLGKLKIASIIDLRSLEEREVAPTLLDDKTGALFLSNDYSLKRLMAGYRTGDGENVYRGMETMLAPQFRAIFKRLLANDGAVLYNCSAGQDRTGIATALLLTALGVDRDTILKDYHLSTQLRRPQNELPLVDPKDFPGNPIVQYYAAAAAKPGGAVAEPLYTPSGASHLVQFFAYLDEKYGGVLPYLQAELGVGPAEIAKLQALYLE